MFALLDESWASKVEVYDSLKKLTEQNSCQVSALCEELQAAAELISAYVPRRRYGKDGSNTLKI